MIREKIDCTKGKLHRHDEAIHISKENPLVHTCIAIINKEALLKEDAEEIGDEFLKRWNAYPDLQTEIERLKNPVKLKIEPSVFTQLLNKIESQQAKIKKLTTVLTKIPLGLFSKKLRDEVDAALAEVRKE